MNNGFSFNLNCSAVMDEVFMECARELDIYKKIPGPNITFAVAAEILPPCVHQCYKHSIFKLCQIKDGQYAARVPSNMIISIKKL
jgi:hypothetical protein